jgi:hypothetical protein
MKRDLLMAFFFGIVFVLGFSAGALSALGDNVTVTKMRNVTISCSNTSSCFVYSDGAPVLFNGNGAELNFSVAVAFSYQENVTIVQNVTVINNTNFTITTTNVTVMNCNASEQTVNVNTDSIASTLTTSIGEACKNACAPGTAERDGYKGQIDGIKNDLTSCQNNAVKLQADLDTIKNITGAQYESLNTTCTERYVAAQEEKLPIWILAVIMALVAAGVIGMVFWRSRMGKTNSGPLAQSELEEK